MKKINLLLNGLGNIFKKRNNNQLQSSILKNIKIQNIYCNEKINKKDHYIYFKEYDIKTNNCDYKKVMKTKKLFKVGNYNKNVILFICFGSISSIILFVFFISVKWNNYYY
ncbi:conserved Plasmodium protein, unknown function [Plasmodium gallinaceum]|uniref:Uncharacterized protein n=1 Tax=Plasmodium gallinaceum TaxID=5849 RepID=A0A1J1GR58_PLAGA|nr:conserved Plasmodium protein, unknown function [Plasmodium gallinaceum]CRG94778.1 conserved Plasmodium protein, unknown function [Plasmodium gallinaceum]